MSKTTPKVGGVCLTCNKMLSFKRKSNMNQLENKTGECLLGSNDQWKVCTSSISILN